MKVLKWNPVDILLPKGPSFLNWLIEILVGITLKIHL